VTGSSLAAAPANPGIAAHAVVNAAVGARVDPETIGYVSLVAQPSSAQGLAVFAILDDPADARSAEGNTMSHSTLRLLSLALLALLATVAPALAADLTIGLATDVTAADVMASIERVPAVPNSPSPFISKSAAKASTDDFNSDREASPFVTDKAGKPLAKNPLKDPRVRKAMSKAIDRPALVSQVMEGEVIAAGQLVPDFLFGATKNLKVEAYDPAGAKKLLAEAGYPDGFGLTIHAPNNRYVNDAGIAQAVAQMLSHIGIDTKVVAMPSSTYFTQATDRDQRYRRDSAALPGEPVGDARRYRVCAANGRKHARVEVQAGHRRQVDVRSRNSRFLAALGMTANAMSSRGKADGPAAECHPEAKPRDLC
jgi:Bacterial extracellular solute-binding proteins, family 5 Middle